MEVMSILQIFLWLALWIRALVDILLILIGIVFVPQIK